MRHIPGVVRNAVIISILTFPWVNNALESKQHILKLLYSLILSGQSFQETHAKWMIYITVYFQSSTQTKLCINLIIYFLPGQMNIWYFFCSLKPFEEMWIVLVYITSSSHPFSGPTVTPHSSWFVVVSVLFFSCLRGQTVIQKNFKQMRTMF